MSPLPRQLSEEITVLSMTDLRLIHHWTLQAYRGFGNTAEEEIFWQTQLPSLGYVHPFLMHILLAVSSLHLARLSPDDHKHFMAVAARHQSTALPAYRQELEDLESNVDEQKGRAMVSFASLTAVYALLCPPVTDAGMSTAVSAITQLSDSFLLLRGAREVLAIVGDCVEGCTMSSQVHALYGDVNLSLNPEDARLAGVEVLIIEDAASRFVAGQAKQANSEALYLLRWCFAMLSDSASNINVKRAINIWIEAVPQAYLEAVRDLQPGALVILAHWCIMLNRAQMYWYLQDSAAHVLSSIWDVLDEDWREKISWPLQAVTIRGWKRRLSQP